MAVTRLTELISGLDMADVTLFIPEITGYVSKIGLLLTEIFERIFNPNENGHLVMGGRFFLIAYIL